MYENSDIGTGSYRWVKNFEDLESLKRSILSSSEIVFDLETTGLNEHAKDVIVYVPKMVGRGAKRHEELVTRIVSVQARVALAQFTLPLGDRGEWDGEEPVTWLLPLSHPESWLERWEYGLPGAGPTSHNWMKVLRQVLRIAVEANKPFVGHNIKYDAKYAWATTGINIAPLILWDTADASRILEAGKSAKLADACKREFETESWKDVDLRAPGAAEGVPLQQLGEYGARDTWWTWKLSINQRRKMFLKIDAEPAPEPLIDSEIREAKAGKLALWVAMPTVRSLARIENRGILLDRERTRTLLNEAELICSNTLTEMSTMYGMDPKNVSSAPTSHWFREFTTRGMEVGDLRLMELTPTGRPKWTKTTLNKIALQKGPDSVAAVILEQRKYAKRAEFLRVWLEQATDIDEIHTSYNTGMVTGRLSSSGPNMQQVTKALRPCFIPRPGYVLADFDFSQIELRVAAYISRSEPMLQAFREGRDLHTLLAAQVAQKNIEDVTANERQMAKAVNFGLLFGLGAFGLRHYAEESYGVVMSQLEAQEFYSAYFETWKGLKTWHQEVEARLLRDSVSLSPLGRIRYFDGTGGNDLNAAINAPVQGMASDLMQIAIASIQGELPGFRGSITDARVVATVHDSAVIELPEDNWEEIAQKIKYEMENPNPILKKLGVELDVPIVVEATIGTRWSLSDVGVIT